MEKFSAAAFFKIGSAIAMMSEQPKAFTDIVCLLRLAGVNEDFITEAQRTHENQLKGSADIKKYTLILIDWIKKECSTIGLRAACSYLSDTEIRFSRGQITATEVMERMETLREMIYHEMHSILFLHVSYDKAKYYEQQEPLLEREVLDKWPSLVEDMSEAGKCFALSRPTACVFHLMRVMEVGVQEFGKVLQVSLATEKSWGNILNEAKAKIDALPRHHSLKSAFNEIWTHLDSVRLAWRNETMHPKQTYTPEEAEEIFSHVRAYIRSLFLVLKS